MRLCEVDGRVEDGAGDVETGSTEQRATDTAQLHRHHDPLSRVACVRHHNGRALEQVEGLDAVSEHGVPVSDGVHVGHLPSLVAVPLAPLGRRAHGVEQPPGPLDLAPAGESQHQQEVGDERRVPHEDGLRRQAEVVDATQAEVRVHDGRVEPQLDLRHEQTARVRPARPALPEPVLERSDDIVRGLPFRGAWGGLSRVPRLVPRRVVGRVVLVVSAQQPDDVLVLPLRQRHGGESHPAEQHVHGPGAGEQVGRLAHEVGRRVRVRLLLALDVVETGETVDDAVTEWPDASRRQETRVETRQRVLVSRDAAVDGRVVVDARVQLCVQQARAFVERPAQRLDDDPTESGRVRPRQLRKFPGPPACPGRVPEGTTTTGRLAPVGVTESRHPNATL